LADAAHTSTIDGVVTVVSAMRTERHYLGPNPHDLIAASSERLKASVYCAKRLIKQFFGLANMTKLGDPPFREMRDTTEVSWLARCCLIMFRIFITTDGRSRRLRVLNDYRNGFVPHGIVKIEEYTWIGEDQTFRALLQEYPRTTPIIQVRTRVPALKNVVSDLLGGM